MKLKLLLVIFTAFLVSGCVSPGSTPGELANSVCNYTISDSQIFGEWVVVDDGAAVIFTSDHFIISDPSRGVLIIAEACYMGKKDGTGVLLSTNTTNGVTLMSQYMQEDYHTMYLNMGNKIYELHRKLIKSISA